MSIRFNKQYAKFNRILEMHEDRENPNRSFAKVVMATSWKQNDGTRKYSDWIARFHGKASQNLSSLEKGDLIICDGSFTHEGYEKEGKRTYSEPTLTVFEWTKWVKQEDQMNDELPPEDDIPF